MAQSKAHIKASNKYNQKAYDRININVPKGERERYKEYAERKGMSLNALFIQLIRQDMGEALTEHQNEDTTEPHNTED